MKYVYLLKAGANHYKVGVAKSVTKRIYSIQTSNANKIYVVTARLCDNALRVEKQMHNALKSMSTDGGKEWFKLDPDDVVRMAIMLNREPEIEIYSAAETSLEIIEQRDRNKRIERTVNQIHTLLEPSHPMVVLPEFCEDIPAGEDYVQKAREIIRTEGKASTSMLQRRLAIGYGRAARIIDELEAEGMITAGSGNSPRQVLV